MPQNGIPTADEHHRQMAGIKQRHPIQPEYVRKKLAERWRAMEVQG